MNKPIHPTVIIKFRLYIAGETQNSMHAISNLSSLCRTYFADRHEIELVDVFREPKRALEDRILMTPTLVKLEPRPPNRIVGTLSQMPLVMQLLGMAAGAL
jgi:circadian clock protein KaiB